MPKAEEQIVEVITELVFLPTPDQRRAKAAFWTRFSDTPLCAPDQIILSTVKRLVPDHRLDRWYRIPGFPEWFCNREEFRERVENLVHLALDTLESVMLDPNGQHSAKVNAAKLLMEVGKKMPPKTIKEIYMDDKIGRMGRAELEEYIRRGSGLLPAAQISNKE